MMQKQRIVEQTALMVEEIGPKASFVDRLRPLTAVRRRFWKCAHPVANLINYVR